MADLKIQEQDLLNYMRSMTVYAIKHHRGDVVNLLAQIGIVVPDSVDDKTLHAIVLRALMDSENFSNNFGSLLHVIAMEGNEAKRQSFANADGTPTTNGSNKSFAAQVFTPEMITGIIGTGLMYWNQQLEKNGGNKAITDEVNAAHSTPPPPAKKFPWGAIIGVSAAIGITIFVVSKVRSKNAAAASPAA